MKKYGIIVLILAMTVGLTGCGGFGIPKNTNSMNMQSATNDTTVSIDISKPFGSSTEEIIENANKTFEDKASQLRAEWETLKGKITDYRSYVSNADAVENFYERILLETTDMCTAGYKAALDYAKAVDKSGADYGDKYDDAKNISDDIYDDLMDIIKDDIYEDLFKDMQRHLYDGVLDDSDDAPGVDYSDWYNAKSDEYGQWYDAKSDVYEEWYDAKSDIYEFYYDFASEVYGRDQKRIDKVITKFEEKIQKRL